MELIDSHAHLGPMPAAYMSMDADGLVAEQRRLGIEASIVSSFEALQWSLARGNEDVVRAAEKHPSIYVSVVLNPRQMGDSERLVQRFGGHPKVLGIKIHPVKHGYDLDMQMVGELLEMARPCGLPVLSHCEMEAPVSGTALRRRAVQFPDMTFIVAHWGIAGRGPGERIAEILDGSAPPNLFVDMASRRTAEYGFFEYAVRTIGADRILWGSDATVIEPAAMLGVLQMADLTDAERRQIAYANALRVYGERLAV